MTMAVQALANPMWLLLCSDKLMSKTILKMHLQSDTYNLQNFFVEASMWQIHIGTKSLKKQQLDCKCNQKGSSSCFQLPTQKFCDAIAICDRRQCSVSDTLRYFDSFCSGDVLIFGVFVVEINQYQQMVVIGDLV